MKTIEEIRTAFQAVHHAATGKSDRSYMSIPADPERDADLIVSAAIDELEQLRKVAADLETLRVVLDSVLESGGAATPVLTKVAEELGLKAGPEHIFAEYSYGWRGVAEGSGQGHITITGTALCGRALGYGGNWSAQTQDAVLESFRDGIKPAGRYCNKCLLGLPYPADRD